MREDIEISDQFELAASYVNTTNEHLYLTGKAGTGKTTFMKRVLQSLSQSKGDPKTIYTKDMAVLKEPSFWSDTLQSVRPNFLVLDDLDKELTPRTEVKQNTIVNQMLSLSNGLFENNLKIIITTNLVDEGIDSAVLRAGRCFEVLNLPFLGLDYAKDLWLGVDQRTEAEWDLLFPTTLENVTQALYMSNLESLTLGNTRDYLTDKSISVREKYSLGN